MSRISKKVMIVLALSLVFVMIFAGCSKMKQDTIPGGDAGATVTNNGGLAVKQGDYLYFINGMTAVADIKTDTDNEFGTVVKGAIMRGKIDASGNVTEIVRLVPLMSTSTMKTGGINVFGNWVYYTTPCTTKDKNGNMQTSLVDFMRTSINGEKTELVARLGAVTDYKFTSDALIFTSGPDLFKVSYNDKKVLDKPEGVKIAEEVTSVVMPRNDTFVPGQADVTNVVFYTKASTDEEAKGNIVYAIGTAKDSVAVELINATTYGKDEYQIKLNSCAVVDGGIELYYEKANGKVESPTGLHMSLYKDGKLDVANEVRLTDAPYTSFYNRANGFYVNEGGKLSTIKKEKVQVGADEIEIFKKTEVINIEGAEIVDFIDYTFTNKQGEAVVMDSVLYTKGGRLYVRVIDDSNIAVPAKAIYNGDNKYTINSSWLAPEIINGRVFFFNSDFYNYVESVGLDGSVAQDENGKLTHPLATLNQVDKDAETAKAEAEKNNK